MIYSIGHNIISPLGFSSADNYNAVRKGRVGLALHNDLYDIPEPFYGSVIDKTLFEQEFNHYFIAGQYDEYTLFEKMLLLSIFKANEMAEIDLSSPDTLFIISTTKGNVELLGKSEDAFHLWHSAQRVTNYYGNTNRPLIVSNACISGAAAQLEALRNIQNGRYKHVVVAGCDVLSKFVISGFQSFKALSSTACRPFDKDRCGLNLGEAAATIIYSHQPGAHTDIALVSGAVKNDARHISAPSIEAVGLTNALNEALSGIDTTDIAFVSSHGTATIYNDDMEALALTKVNLEHTPVNSLKGHFGHTLGAAALLESIVSMLALNDGIALKSTGFLELGTKASINITTKDITTDKNFFVKTVSGFGGGNAALVFRKWSGIQTPKTKFATSETATLNITSHIILRDSKIKIDGLQYESEQCGNAMLDDLYRQTKISYLKFFKMDPLCKAGFLASELLMRQQNIDESLIKEDTAIILMNRSASSEDDLRYLESIASAENYYPSPSIFVYTLPNIVTGEIAIRNKIFGETAFYIAETFDIKQLISQVRLIMAQDNMRKALCGWVEYFRDTCEVFMMLIHKDETNKPIFNHTNIENLWKA